MRDSAKDRSSITAAPLTRRSSPQPSLRVLVSWWVIGDGSFPRARVGDEVDVVVELITGTASRLNEPVTAIARPAYGHGPRQGRDGGLRWWHLLYGHGWSAGWWSDTPRAGRVALDGYFVADIASDRDGPIAVSGRISSLHSVDIRLDPLDGGGRQEMSGTEELIQIAEVPSELGTRSVPDDGHSHRAVTSVLVDLDLGDPPYGRSAFEAGAVDTCGDVVWVMHRSDPTLLRIDTRCDPVEVVKLLLPLTIELPDGGMQRRLHATPDGCWIVGEHDIHRVVDAGRTTVTFERVCVGGGMASVLFEGEVYVLGSTRDRLVSDRRHGMIRRPAAREPMQVCDLDTHTLRAVTDPSTVFEVRRQHRRPDMATAADGVRWCAGHSPLARVRDGERHTVDVSGATVGSVEWVQPDPRDDPATAKLIDEITVDVTTFVRVDDAPSSEES